QTQRSMGFFCIRSVTESASARSRGPNFCYAPSGFELDADAMAHSTKLLPHLKDGDMPSNFLIPLAAAGLLLFGSLFAVEPSICLAQVPEKESTDETDDPTNPLIPEFRRCDTDHDGVLTEAEYCRRIGFSLQDLHREFVVFDANEDARISLAEFLTVPV